MKWTLTHNDRILTLTEATGLEIDQLKLSFRRQTANAKWDPRVKKGWWDGYISYFKSDRYLPSGLWSEVVDVCKLYDFELHIEGIENKFDRDIDQEELQSWVDEKWSNVEERKPRDYQINTVFNIIKYQNCLAELATSAGKTLITYMTIAYLLETKKARKVLMIVPTVDLVVQGTEDFYQYNEESCKLKIDIQQIFAGSVIREKSNIVIGTYQSLVKKDKTYFDQFDTVIVDETHKAKSASIKTILEKCENAGRKFGLSGTIPKPGTLDRLTLMAYTGPVITSIRADYLMEQGHITPCEVYVIEMDYARQEVKDGFKMLFQRSEEDRKKLLNLEQQYAIQSEERLEFITDMILKNNKNSLVLFYRIEYGNKIYDKLRTKTDRKIFYIDGSVNKDLREYQKDMLEEGEGKIMIASFGTFSTGINVKNIHTIYLTESFKSEVIIRQSIGRGLRKHANKKKLVIIDFVDDYCSGKFKNYLYKHSEVRQGIYTDQNFPFSIRRMDLKKIYSKNSE
jgi:superfamily II DNA or RNA helicase